jgi:hypothetical protein
MKTGISRLFLSAPRRLNPCHPRQVRRPMKPPHGQRPFDPLHRFTSPLEVLKERNVNLGLTVGTPYSPTSTALWSHEHTLSPVIFALLRSNPTPNAPVRPSTVFAIATAWRFHAALGLALTHATRFRFAVRIETCRRTEEYVDLHRFGSAQMYCLTKCYPGC